MFWDVLPERIAPGGFLDVARDNYSKSDEIKRLQDMVFSVKMVLEVDAGQWFVELRIIISSREVPISTTDT